MVTCRAPVPSCGRPGEGPARPGGWSAKAAPAINTGAVVLLLLAGATSYPQPSSTTSSRPPCPGVGLVRRPDMGDLGVR